MTFSERIESYRKTFWKWPASVPWVGSEQGRECLYAIWLIGQDYRNKTRFYGAYPKGFLERVMTLFPDMDGTDILHVFSGSVPPGDYTRCDSVQDAEYQCSVYDLAEHAKRRWRLVLADPPYTSEDAKRYHTRMVDRRRAMRALADVVEPGGFVVWLDTVWPMHRKTEFVTVGRIMIQRSTNHRVRVVTIFQRTGADAV